MLEPVRRNPLIAASVALPLLLVLVFALAGRVPRMLVDDPAYDLVLAQNDPVASDVADIGVDVVVDDGQVVARVTRSGGPAPRERPRVYIVDHRTGSAREATIDWPNDADALEHGASLTIPELSGKKVSTALRAPDGYEYRGIDYHDGFFFGFFGGQRTDRISIGKGAAIIPIDLPDPAFYGYHSIRFVGWIVE